jgi:hypothetical protein
VQLHVTNVISRSEIRLSLGCKLMLPKNSQPSA